MCMLLYNNNIIIRKNTKYQRGPQRSRNVPRFRRTGFGFDFAHAASDRIFLESGLRYFRYKVQKKKKIKQFNRFVVTTLVPVVISKNRVRGAK